MPITDFGAQENRQSNVDNTRVYVYDGHWWDPYFQIVFYWENTVNNMDGIARI